MRERAWWEWIAIGLIAAGVWAFVNRAQIRRWRARRRFEAMGDGPMPPIPPDPQDPHGPALAEALQGAGFFAGLTPERAAQLQDAVRRDGYGAVFTHEGRAFALDDEDLAEGFVADALDRAAPVFEHLGLAPVRGASRFEDGGAHWLDIDGTSLPLMSLEEVERDRPGAQQGLSWGLVGARLLDHLSERSARAGRAERFYSVGGGNDAFALALTPAMLEALRRHAGQQPHRLPYRRTEAWPDFGLPEST
jgi:hypothetical protein